MSLDQSACWPVWPVGLLATEARRHGGTENCWTSGFQHRDRRHRRDRRVSDAAFVRHASTPRLASFLFCVVNNKKQYALASRDCMSEQGRGPLPSVVSAVSAVSAVKRPLSPQSSVPPCLRGQ